MSIKVTYLDNVITLPDDTTVEEARDKMARLYNEVEDAEGHMDEDGNIKFRVVSGDKGAGNVRVVFGDVSVNLPEGTTVEEARDQLSGLYDSIEDAEGTYDEENNVIRFRLSAGDKGK